MTLVDVDIERADWLRKPGRAVHVLIGTRHAYLELIACDADEGTAVFGWRLLRWSVHVDISGRP